MDNSQEYAALLKEFIESVEGNVSPYATRARDLQLPSVGATTICDLCLESKALFAADANLLKLSPPCIVVGDIHGHLLDLLRILIRYGLPTAHTYLFLGDIVDRGEFSIECIVIVLLLKILYPKNFYTIRGNHEFEFLCTQCGFSKQIYETYGSESLLDNFLEVFDEMPLAAKIGDDFLCLHGGIGPELFSTAQLEAMRRPIHDFGSNLIDSLVWSDPSGDFDFFTPSNRGTGYLFGKQALSDFLFSVGIRRLIRGHECVQEGADLKFGGQCITVFSASNYCGLVNNLAAVLEISNSGVFSVRSFPPLPYLKRTSVRFGGDSSRSKKKKYSLCPSLSDRRLPKLLPQLNSSPLAPGVTAMSNDEDRDQLMAHLSSVTNKPIKKNVARIPTSQSIVMRSQSNEFAKFRKNFL